jgi:hypothetical protein
MGKGQWRAQQEQQRMAGTAALSSFLSLIQTKISPVRWLL